MQPLLTQTQGMSEGPRKSSRIASWRGIPQRSDLKEGTAVKVGRRRVVPVVETPPRLKKTPDRLQKIMVDSVKHMGVHSVYYADNQHQRTLQAKHGNGECVWVADFGVVRKIWDALMRSPPHGGKNSKLEQYP